MPTSDAAVQVAPLYGLHQRPEAAAQLLSVTTGAPSRLRTVSRGRCRESLLAVLVVRAMGGGGRSFLVFRAAEVIARAVTVGALPTSWAATAAKHF